MKYIDLFLFIEEKKSLEKYIFNSLIFNILNLGFEKKEK